MVAEQRRNMNAGSVLLALSVQQYFLLKSAWFSALIVFSAVWCMFFWWRQFHLRSRFGCHTVRNLSQIWYTALVERANSLVLLLPVLGFCLLYMGYSAAGNRGLAVASLAFLTAVVLTLLAERYPLATYA